MRSKADINGLFLTGQGVCRHPGRDIFSVIVSQLWWSPGEMLIEEVGGNLEGSCGERETGTYKRIGKQH